MRAGRSCPTRLCAFRTARKPPEKRAITMRRSAMAAFFNIPRYMFGELGRAGGRGRSLATDGRPVARRGHRLARTEPDGRGARRARPSYRLRSPLRPAHRTCTFPASAMPNLPQRLGKKAAEACSAGGISRRIAQPLENKGEKTAKSGERIESRGSGCRRAGIDGKSGGIDPPRASALPYFVQAFTCDAIPATGASTIASTAMGAGASAVRRRSRSGERRLAGAAAARTENAPVAPLWRPCAGSGG